MKMSRKSKKTKNGYVLIADIGPPSSKLLNQKTFAEITKDCLHVFIQQKIFFNNSDDISFILAGSESTENELDYKHIHVLSKLEPVNWELSRLVEKFVRTKNCVADWMDALLVALDLIHKQVESGSVYESIQIIFFTAFESPFKSSTETLKACVSALLSKKTQIFFVGSNCENELIGQEEKMSKGELVAWQLLKETSELGRFYSFGEFSSDILNCTEQPKIGMPWNVSLDIGSSIKIPVSGYIKVRKCDSLKWSEETNTSEALVDKERTFQKESRTDVIVDKEDVIPAYKYGSTYIPFTNDEEKNLSYISGSKCLSVLAFVDPIPPQLRIGPGTMYFFPHRKSGLVDRSAQIALSALIYAMAETNKVALVRRVYQLNSKVTIGVLSPRIKFKYECLVFNELPFSDDWRPYEFAPIVTLKNPPNQEQLDAIDLLIDTLDLTAAEERGNFGFESTQMFDPFEEYIRYVVAFKAIHPDDPLPEIPSHIKMNLQAAPSMTKEAKVVLDRLKNLFPLEETKSLKVKHFEASKRSATLSNIPATAEEEEIEAYKKKTRLDESSEIDLMSILGADVIKVGTTNPVKDFSLLLEMGKKPVKEIYDDMEKVIIELLKDSGGTNQSLMTKVKSCLQAYREHALANNRAVDFNRWMERFKEHVADNYFSDFWQKYVLESQLGLITKKESSASTVDEEQAEQFIHLSTLNESIEMLDEDEELAQDSFNCYLDEKEVQCLILQ